VIEPGRPARHEIVWILLLVATSVTLLVRSGPALPVLEISGMLVAIFIALRAPLRIRIAIDALMTLWFYHAVRRIVPLMDFPAQDDTLLAWDRWLFGESPAVTCGSPRPAIVADLLAAGYLTFHVYLGWILIDVLVRPTPVALRDAARLFVIFALGDAGYWLVPANGPAFAHGDLYAGPIDGGWITATTLWAVELGSSRFDVFPSLHIGATLLFLEIDWRRNRRRLATMIVPALLTMVAAVALRLHYAVDAIAGVAVAALAWMIVPPEREAS
jgi:hypothetical protein